MGIAPISKVYVLCFNIKLPTQDMRRMKRAYEPCLYHPSHIVPESPHSGFVFDAVVISNKYILSLFYKLCKAFTIILFSPNILR